MKLKTCILILFICIGAKGYSQKQYAAFNHVAIIVADAEKSAGFYIRMFHLDTLHAPFGGHSVLWLSLGCNESLHIIQGSKSEVTVSKGNHIAFSVASLDDFMQRLTKENIPFDGGSDKPETFTVRGDGVRQIYFHDPDGYRIEVNDAK